MIDYLKKRADINLDPAPYEASVLADSITAGVRLTTCVLKIPRFELPAFNTHRVFSRNSASSRAIPVHKRIQQVREEPYIPLVFGKNKRGMQSEEEVKDTEAAQLEWNRAQRSALASAAALAELGVHKQLANRLLEPFSFQTVIVTATEWANWEALRISKQAQGEIALAARNLKAAMDASTPAELKPGQWHLPLVFHGDWKSASFGERYGAGTHALSTDRVLAQISAARCARVSYLTHGGVRDLKADIYLYYKLRDNGHMSPLEHPAVAGKWVGEYDDLTEGEALGGGSECWGGSFIGNFRAPWIQLRKMLPNEAVFQGE